MSLHPRMSAPVLLTAALAGSGCDGNATIHAGAVGPSPVTSTFVNVARGALVQPSLITAVPVAGAFCPTLPPFIAPFTLVFDAGGRSDLFLAQVHLQFVDHVGVVSGSTTLRHTELVTRFGSTTLPVIGTRAFPFSFPFGCVGAPTGNVASGFSRTGTLIVMVLAGDSLGRTSTMRVEVPVRRLP